MNNDNHKSNSIKSKLSSFISSNTQKVMSNILPVLLVVFLLPLQSHAVYRTGKKSILASKSSSSVTTPEVEKKTKNSIDKNNRKIDVEVVITDNDENKNDNQIDYQKYGLIMAAATVAFSLLSPSGTSNKKKSTKAPKAAKTVTQFTKSSKNKKTEDDDDDDYDDDFVPNKSFRSRMNDPNVPPTKKVSENVRKIISSSELLKPPDDILDVFDEDVDIDVRNNKKSKIEIKNDDDDDDLFADDIINTKKASKSGKNADSNDIVSDSNRSPSVTKKFRSKIPAPKNDNDDDDDDDLFADDKNSDSKSNSISSLKATKVDPVDNKAVVPTPPSPPSSPPPPPAKKNIFQKIFSKPGAGRITDINQVLRIDDAAQDMRLLIANALKPYVNADLFDFEDSPYNKADANDDDSRASLVSNTMAEFGLSSQETANAFADVASAMLVTLTDTAGDLYDAKKNDDLLLALDDIAEFVRGAGSMFSKTTPDAVIEPVLYNGKAKSGKLENLYLEYLKSTMSVDSFMGMLGGESEQSDKDLEEKSKKLEYRSNGLIRIQQVFSIKEGKRNSLEQKVTKDILMNMVKGEGGLGNIGDMMSALTGKAGDGGLGGLGGLGGDFDMDAMMKSMGDEGMPDVDNMSPEEMAALSTDAMSSIKEAIKSNSITKNDIAALEKMMGIDINSVTSMMEKGQIDKKKLASMGQEGEDIMEIFKALGKLK